MNARRANALIELVLTLALLAIVAAVAVPSVRTIMDRMSVRAAKQDVVLALWAARTAAGARGDYASFVVDVAAGRLRVICAGDTVFTRDLAARRGVTVTATRDSITYAPTGMGYGAANTTIALFRGTRADTVTTSRLGRVSF
jgi:Tfp pilus assembly protein FimT